VLCSCEADGPGELSIKNGEIVTVLAKNDTGWWRGRRENGEEGYFPSNFTERVFSHEV